MEIFLVVFLRLLALGGAVIFWGCLIYSIVEWRYIDIFERIGYILATAVGLTAVITCSYIMAVCL